MIAMSIIVKLFLTCYQWDVSSEFLHNYIDKNIYASVKIYDCEIFVKLKKVVYELKQNHYECNKLILKVVTSFGFRICNSN